MRLETRLIVVASVLEAVAAAFEPILEGVAHGHELNALGGAEAVLSGAGATVSTPLLRVTA